MTEINARTIKSLTNMLDSANATLTKFKAELESNPFEAFRWAESAIYASAMVSTTTAAINLINANSDDDTIRLNLVEILTDHVMNSAKYPSRSSSPMSNLTDQDMTRARCEVIERIKYYL